MSDILVYLQKQCPSGFLVVYTIDSRVGDLNHGIRTGGEAFQKEFHAR